MLAHAGAEGEAPEKTCKILVVLFAWVAMLVLTILIYGHFSGTLKRPKGTFQDKRLK